MSNFINDCINGDALIYDIDDYIDQWHDGDYNISLSEYLGMSEKEYALYLQDESYLGFIIKAHKEGDDIENIIINQIPLAARSDNHSKAQRLERWLKNEGLWD
jgi:hypothetical protein